LKSRVICPMLKCDANFFAVSEKRRGRWWNESARWEPSMRASDGWISLDIDAGLALSRGSRGFKATCVLFGSRRKADRAVFDLLKGYGAADHARITRLGGQPKTSHITGLAFSDRRHLALVLARLKDRHFPTRINGGGAPEGPIYLPPPYHHDRSVP
jgi:hypothetical protein